MSDKRDREREREIGERMLGMDIDGGRETDQTKQRKGVCVCVCVCVIVLNPFFEDTENTKREMREMCAWEQRRGERRTYMKITKIK